MDFSDAFNAAKSIVDYLKNSGVEFSKGAIVSYDAHKIQYRYDMKLGSLLSKTDEISRTIKSKISKPIELNETISISGYCLPNNENLLECNIIRNEGNKTIIDIPRLLKTIQSDSVIITFEKNIPIEEMQRLLPFPHMFRNPLYTDETMEEPIEISVDYANFWYNHFDYFQIRDIKRTLNIEFSPVEIFDFMPINIKNKFKKIAQTKHLDSQMINLLKIVSKIFKKFSSDQTIRKTFSRIVSTDKPKNVQIVDLQGLTQEVFINGEKLTIPDKLSITMDISLEGKDLAISAKLIVNKEGLNNTVKTLCDEAEQMTKNISV